MNRRVWVSKEYTLTPDTIIISDAVWGSRYRSHNLKGVTNLQLSQSYIGRKLNYGTITIYFMGGSSVNLTNINDPLEHLQDINSLIFKGHIEIKEEITEDGIIEEIDIIED